MKSNYLLHHNASLESALKQLEENRIKILFLVDDSSVLTGSLTDGDIRRWILKKNNLDAPAKDICNSDPYVFKVEMNQRDAIRILQQKQLKAIPLIDAENRVQRIYTISSIEEPGQQNIDASIPVVIMAGGKGTRLDPATRTVPKALMPLGDKTVIDHIIDHFSSFGLNRFIISLNYKAEMIREHFANSDNGLSVEFVEEQEPLGTAGSLSLMSEIINQTFFLTNCDVLVDFDLNSLMSWHKSNSNDFTIVSALQKYSIPFGVCKIDDDGDLDEIEEKPEFDLLVNTGLYVIEPKLLPLVPETAMDMTDFISRVRSNGNKVNVFPIPGTSYQDTGEWDSYSKAVEKIKKSF